MRVDEPIIEYGVFEQWRELPSEVAVELEQVLRVIWVTAACKGKYP
jgi:hypothetical protein